MQRLLNNREKQAKKGDKLWTRVDHQSGQSCLILPSCVKFSVSNQIQFLLLI